MEQHLLPLSVKHSLLLPLSLVPRFLLQCRPQELGNHAERPCAESSVTAAGGELLALTANDLFRARRASTRSLPPLGFSTQGQRSVRSCVSQVLEEKERLTRLSLRQNGIKEDGARMLLEAGRFRQGFLCVLNCHSRSANMHDESRGVRE